MTRSRTAVSVAGSELAFSIGAQGTLEAARPVFRRAARGPILGETVGKGTKALAVKYR